MFVAVATRTMQGAARRAKEREQGAPAIMEPPPQRRALAVSPVASNVVRFRRPTIVHHTAWRMPSSDQFSRAKHLAFLASLHIATNTPAAVLISRVAAWHGFTAEQMIESHGPRARVEARIDCIVTVMQAYPNLSMQRIGKIFGGRDHTTILHYLRKRGIA